MVFDVDSDIIKNCKDSVQETIALNLTQPLKCPNYNGDNGNKYNNRKLDLRDFV